MARSGERKLARLPVSVVILLIALLAVSLIGVSPLVLEFFRGATVQWERLSFIGQTYGAASAVISVLALVGVVLTLNYQARETKRAREETRRQAISDLLKMAMTDPDLDECWGPLPEPGDPKTRKQQLYTNMIISAWEMSFEMRATPERRLRYNANEMFCGQVGREFWRNARGSRISTSASKRERRFHRILDEEYQKAVNSSGADVDAQESGSAREHQHRGLRNSVWYLLWAAVGVGLTVAFCKLLRREEADVD